MEFKRGYTLVEMITVLAIIVILTSVFISFGVSKQKFILQRDIYILSENARRIQEMAMSIGVVGLGTGCYDGKAIVPEGGFGLQITSEATDTPDDKDTLDDNNQKYWLYANCRSHYTAEVIGLSQGYYPSHNLKFNAGVSGETEENIFKSPVPLSNNVKISKIMAGKIDATGTLNFEKIYGVTILYYPPDPKVQIFETDKISEDDDSIGLGGRLDAVEVTLELTVGEEKETRVIEFNKFGLISVKQK